jgi:hypothetical protein
MQNKKDEHPSITFTFLKSLYQYCNGGFIHILLKDRAGIAINKFVSLEKMEPRLVIVIGMKGIRLVRLVCSNDKEELSVVAFNLKISTALGLNNKPGSPSNIFGCSIGFFFNQISRYNIISK